MCIELGLGVKILGVLGAAMGIFAIVQIVLGILKIILPPFNVLILLNLIFLVPPLLSGVYCIMWLRKDEAPNRKRLSFAMLINLISFLAASVFALIGEIPKGFGNVLGT